MTFCVFKNIVEYLFLLKTDVYIRDSNVMLIHEKHKLRLHDSMLINLWATVFLMFTLQIWHWLTCLSIIHYKP